MAGKRGPPQRDGFRVEAVDLFDDNPEAQTAFRVKGKESQLALWKNLEKSEKHLTMRFYDGKKIPFENNEFDVVLAHAVLEHIPTAALGSVLSELNRTMKRGGTLVVARTPNTYSFSEWMARILRLGSHEILFKKQEILGILEQCGFLTLFYTKTELFPEMAPGRLMSIVNAVSPVIHFFDSILSRTPLALFSHHHFIILKKL